MSITLKASEVSLPSADFEKQALLFTVPRTYKEFVSLQSSSSDLFQSANPNAGKKLSALFY